MTCNRTLTTAVLVTAGSLVWASGARAGTISLDKGCYIEKTRMVVSGTGFAPNSDLTLSGNGAFGTVVADEAGGFVTALAAPINGTIGARSKDIVKNTLTARDFSDPAQDTSADYRVTNFAFSVADSGGNPRKKRRFDLSGFPRGKTVWAHYRFGGRTLGTVKFGKAKGDCGLVSTKMALLPNKVPLRYGKWKVQWDTARKYKSTSKPRLSVPLTIFRTFR